MQRRALIANQDQEYMESLRIDQEKVTLCYFVVCP